MSSTNTHRDVIIGFGLKKGLAIKCHYLWNSLKLEKKHNQKLDIYTWEHL